MNFASGRCKNPDSFFRIGRELLNLKLTTPPQAMKCEACLLNFMASSGEFTSGIKLKL